MLQWDYCNNFCYKNVVVINDAINGWAKKLSLLWGKIDQSRKIKQAKFTYSSIEKVFEKKIWNYWWNKTQSQQQKEKI